MHFKTHNFQRIFPVSMLPYTFTSAQQYHINMLSREYAPIPLNVVRTYRIQYLLILDSFLEFCSNTLQITTNCTIMREYFELALHITKISTAPICPLLQIRRDISNFKGRVKPVQN